MIADPEELGAKVKVRLSPVIAVETSVGFEFASTVMVTGGAVEENTFPIGITTGAEPCCTETLLTGWLTDIGKEVVSNVALNKPLPCVPATTRPSLRERTCSTTETPNTVGSTWDQTVDGLIAFVEYNPVLVPTKYASLFPTMFSHLTEGPLPEPSGFCSKFPLTFVQVAPPFSVNQILLIL